jgi:2-dehydro-3-deoxy-D-arabinonate dehydratase
MKSKGEIGMAERLLIRFHHPEQGIRVGLQVDNAVHDVTALVPSIGAWLQSSAGQTASAIEQLASQAKSAPSIPTAQFASGNGVRWLAPVDTQDIWAAGVTYERSRAARQEESVDGGDIYARVYSAERPELFFKAHGPNVVAPFGEVGIRADATWSVPEPELALVINPAMEVIGFTIGNDMSSRDIEGENPLYLPQAKVYNASCALGPGILLHPSTDWLDTTIRIVIKRGDSIAFQGEIHTSRIKRRIGELVSYLGRSNHFPNGVVLLTGTGVVPPGEFTLAAGDVVEITIDRIGTLVNTVKVV